MKLLDEHIPLLPLDRLMPADPAGREIATRIYDRIAKAPIHSPHGHVDAGILRRNEPFQDPSSLLITPDHYVTRLLHASGVPMAELGVGEASSSQSQQDRSREIWRILCHHWGIFAGTPVRMWLEAELQDVFGIDLRPSAATSDDIFDALTDRLSRPEFLPRALFDRFRIATLSTTNDPADNLEHHRALALDPTMTGRVLPSFRADRYLDPLTPNWSDNLDVLARAADTDTGTYAGLLEALRRRRAYFIENGATATDTGVVSADSDPLSEREAESIHARLLREARSGGTLDEADAARYRANLLYRSAEMSADDGLVMQLHAGVFRNHHPQTLERFGPDTGHDIPLPTTFVRPLAPVLSDFGTSDRFRIVLFAVDETTYSREVGPLAGFYPSVFAGAPWWFLDSFSAMKRYREAITDSAGFTKTSGFIDDTRAFCSIPARHDVARRVDAGFLAGLVSSGQLPEDEAAQIAGALVDTIPREVFRLG